MQAAGIHYHCHDCLAAQPDNVMAEATTSKPFLDPSKKFGKFGKHSVKFECYRKQNRLINVRFIGSSG